VAAPSAVGCCCVREFSAEITSYGTTCRRGRDPHILGTAHPGGALYRSGLAGSRRDRSGGRGAWRANGGAGACWGQGGWKALLS